MESGVDWDVLKEKTLEAATLTTGTRPRSGGSSVSVEKNAIVDENCVARLAGDRRHQDNRYKDVGFNFGLTERGSGAKW